MEKNEILEKSRKENKGNDEMVKSIEQKANAYAFRVGFAVAAILYGLDTIFIDSGLIGRTAFIIYSSLLFTKVLMSGIWGKKKREKIIGIIGIVLTSVMAIAFILNQFI